MLYIYQIKKSEKEIDEFDIWIVCVCERERERKRDRVVVAS